MVERDFDQQAYLAERRNRLAKLVNSVKTDREKPSEVISRLVGNAMRRGNETIKQGDSFVVLGIDNHDDWFVVGSSQTVENAFNRVDQNKSEEAFLSNGDLFSATFYVFTRDGIEVRHLPGNEPPITE